MIKLTCLFVCFRKFLPHGAVLFVCTCLVMLRGDRGVPPVISLAQVEGSA